MMSARYVYNIVLLAKNRCNKKKKLKILRVILKTPFLMP